jgi:hypothetical protein
MPPRTTYDWVIVALGSLGGDGDYIHTEDIAAKLHSLAPEKFSWKKPEYKKYPDIFIASKALRDSRRLNFVTGNKRHGWMLTPQGIKQWRSFGDVPKTGKTDKYVGKIKSHPLFAAYKASKLKEATELQFADMLHVSPDRPKEIIQKQFNRVKSRIESSRDREAIRFIKRCAVVFKQFIGE